MELLGEDKARRLMVVRQAVRLGSFIQIALSSYLALNLALRWPLAE